MFVFRAHLPNNNNPTGFILPGCNRTYYGNVGVTYDLELHRPKEDKIPYVCILTFSAAGGEQGDIVQVGKHKRRGVVER